MFRFRWKGLLALMLMAPYVSHAADGINYSIDQIYSSARALGMGGAYSAVADDYNLIFYNPAGFARLEKGQVNMFLRASFDTTGPALKQDIDDAKKNSSDPAAAVTQAIEKNYGSNFYYDVPSLGLIWVRPSWGLAIIPFDLDIEGGIHYTPSLNLTTYAHSLIAYGMGWDIPGVGEHRLSIGFTAKAIYRIYYGTSVQAGELASPNSSLGGPQEGFTADADVGLLFTPQLSEEGLLSWFKYAKPTFSLVVRNALDYGFQNMHLVAKDTTAAPPLQRRIDIGSKWDYPKFWRFQARGVLDIRDIGHQYWNPMKGLHAGVELLWEAWSWLHGAYRLGINQGYLSAGMSGTFVWGTMDLVTWGEEVGVSTAPVQDRRYMVQLSLDF